jgi:hypothetical protein
MINLKNIQFTNHFNYINIKFIFWHDNWSIFLLNSIWMDGYPVSRQPNC